MWRSPDLALLALLQMFLNVGIHSGPVVALSNPFVSFGNFVVSGKNCALSIPSHLGNKFPREIKHS